MKVTALEEYGLRCMMQAAGAGPDRPLTVHEIAAREGLSDPYVAKLMNMLRESGLVDSVRGRSGGYYATRPPERISISEILAALGGQIFESHYCERFPGEAETCVHLGDCSIRSLWGTLEGLVDQVLRRTSLADLMQSEQDTAAGLLSRQRRRLPMVPAGLGAGGHPSPEGSKDE
ncbi:MAG TPA: Rrf2 family transcriptional regulator [Candidatus Polarisedimenticolia bacterium]|nr:Rrf2 family transcriptional regulator [Candidatus Polarisedimenticolia bacterium]